MTDSIAVLPPGWRALDSNGSIITQATLYFYTTDGVTPKEVFSDQALSVSLGTSVACNSGGYPVSGASARVIIYTGSDPYNVLLKDAAGVTIWSHENVRGAVDTSNFLSAGGLVAASPVVSVASNTTRTAADAGKIINANTTGGDITTTLPDAAVDVDNGFRIGLRHGGTANQHILTSAGGAFAGITPAGTVTQVALSQPGEVMWFVSNGTSWVLDVYVPPLRNTMGIITIVDILSAPPVSPEAGARYILGSAPTGAWSTFAQHDIAEYTGAGWFKITPPTDCGWIAYDQSADELYQFRGAAWNDMRATETTYGLTQYASSAAMEAANEGYVVRAHLQHRHPGHPKFWAVVSGGASTLLTSYNVSSVTDGAAGSMTVNFSTAFSTVNWCCTGMAHDTGAGGSDARIVNRASKAASSVSLHCFNVGGGLVDPTEWYVAGFGDQA